MSVFVDILNSITEAGYGYESRWMKSGTPKKHCRFIVYDPSGKEMARFNAPGPEAAAGMAAQFLGIGVQLAMFDRSTA